MRQTFPEILDRVEVEDVFRADVDVGDVDEFHRGIRTGGFGVT
jgi:hypothetical protein